LSSSRLRGSPVITDASTASTTTSGPIASDGLRIRPRTASLSPSRPATIRRSWPDGAHSATRGTPIATGTWRFKYAHKPVKQAGRHPPAALILCTRRTKSPLPREHFHRRPAARARDGGPQLPAQGARQSQITSPKSLAVKIDPSGHLLPQLRSTSLTSRWRGGSPPRTASASAGRPAPFRPRLDSQLDVITPSLLPSYSAEGWNFYVRAGRVGTACAS